MEDKKLMLTGSICLSNIPKEQIKKVMCKDGVERCYLNVAIIPRKEVSPYGHTHFISCSPKKEERKDGVNYIIGDFKEFLNQNNSENINNPNPPQSNDPTDDLPF